MNERSRRVERLEATMGTEALLQRLATEYGMDPDELRTDAGNLAQRYPGMNLASMIDALTEDERLTVDEKDELIASVAEVNARMSG